MIQFGLISKSDGETLMKTIDLLCDSFKDTLLLEICEVGIYAGETGNGIRQYIESKGKQCFKTGIDNDKDGEPIRFHYHQLIIGDSSEVYNQLADESQHMIFVDGDHSFLGVISDFYAYGSKVKKEGFLAFHDTGRHIKPFTDFQHGDKENPDAYISVRKALEAIGLFGGISFIYGEDNCETSNGLSQWKLVFDQADPENLAGGICVFKKLY